jgi:CRP-like cAMP-binding protein
MEDESLYVDYKSGQVIIKEGETANGCFILLSGKAGVYKDQVMIAEINQPGFVFGEISLILNSLRTATVIALEDSHICHIRTDLDTLINKFPTIVTKIMFNLAEELERTTIDLFTSVKLLDTKNLDEEIQ